MKRALVSLVKDSFDAERRHVMLPTISSADPNAVLHSNLSYLSQNTFEGRAKARNSLAWDSAAPLRQQRLPCFPYKPPTHVQPR